VCPRVMGHCKRVLIKGQRLLRHCQRVLGQYLCMAVDSTASSLTTDNRRQTKLSLSLVSRVETVDTVASSGDILRCWLLRILMIRSCD
jgi:hypothetical protein